MIGQQVAPVHEPVRIEIVGVIDPAVMAARQLAWARLVPWLFTDLVEFVAEESNLVWA